LSSKLLGRGAVLGAAAGTGAAENADSFHPAILSGAASRALMTDTWLAGARQKAARNGKTAGLGRWGGAQGPQRLLGHFGGVSWVRVGCSGHDSTP
jgi:hypothetical protein